MSLVVYGGALPTFLLDRIAAATHCRAIRPRPPQAVEFVGVERSKAFDDLLPLIGAENLLWEFHPQPAET